MHTRTKERDNCQAHQTFSAQNFLHCFGLQTEEHKRVQDILSKDLGTNFLILHSLFVVWKFLSGGLNFVYHLKSVYLRTFLTAAPCQVPNELVQLFFTACGLWSLEGTLLWHTNTFWCHSIVTSILFSYLTKHLHMENHALGEALILRFTS